MYPKLFGIELINMYGLLIGIGVIACFAVLGYYCKRKKIDPKFLSFVEWNGLLAIVVGFFSAMLFQSFYNYLENPTNGFHFSFYGLTFIGGLIGGAISFLTVYFTWARKRYKSQLIDILPIIPACILIAHGFGRLGCFCAGCCHGEITDSIFGMYFPYASISEKYKPDIIKVYPTQLFEALFLFALFALCFWLATRKNFKPTFAVYLLGYGIFRFLIEEIRGDERGTFIGNLSPSQFWSIVMIVMAVPVYFLLDWLTKRRRKLYAITPDQE